MPGKPGLLGGCWPIIGCAVYVEATSLVPALCFFCLWRRKSKRPTRRHIAATPPTTPPTIAPVLFFDVGSGVPVPVVPAMVPPGGLLVLLEAAADREDWVEIYEIEATDITERELILAKLFTHAPDAEHV